MPRRTVVEWLSACLLLTACAAFTESLSFTKQPSDTSVFYGSESVILECAVDDSSAKIQWFKDGEEIRENFVKYSFLSRGLRIKPVEKSDAGTYYCQARVEKLRSNEATLTVEYMCRDGFPLKTPGVAFRGEDYKLTCDCPSVPAPAYTWSINGKQSPFQGKEFIVTNTSSEDNGEYICTVASGGREARSLPHNLSVLDCSPARIVNPPAKQTGFVVNKELTIDCKAVGDPVPVVSWYKTQSSNALKNTSRRHILPNGTLHFMNTRSTDVGKYECVAVNSCDNSMAYSTTLVVAKTGSFSPIKDHLSRVGSTVSISCDPPKDSIPKIRNITWQRGDGNPLPSDSRFKVMGNTLQIEKAERNDSGTYKCVAENIAGTTSVDVEVIVAIYPEAILDPVNKTIHEGESAKLECKFSGDPKPKITWEKNGETIPDNVNTTKITYSDDRSMLAINNATSDQSGSYRCSATLKHVTERTKDATVIVREKVVLEKIGSDKFDEGTTARLNCRVVAGATPLDIRWSKVNLTTLPPHMKVEGSKLVMKNVKIDDTGVYKCHVNNSFSSGSLTFKIHVFDFAEIVLRPRNATVEMNGTAMFHCKATGKPFPTMYWYKETVQQPIVYNSRIILLPNNSLLIKNVQKEDEALYRCIAGSSGYLQEAVAQLTVLSGTDGSTIREGKPTDKDEHEPDNMGKTVGIAVGCAGAYIILVVGLMIYCKGRRARQAKNKLIVNGEDAPLKPEDDGDNVEIVKAPEVSNALKFPREKLETLRTLGSGTYGNVFLAKATEIVEGESSSIVVVQSLTSSNEEVKKEYFRRMEMLSLKHDNIAKLLGVCQEEEPMYLISEYPEQGDLKTVMRDSSSPLSPTQKVNICAAVASGMNYLTNHGHVHKDLAARNCLVNKAFDVKISFLSLNQGTYPKEYFKRGSELIPLRWMAPEAINGYYSDMSDVWAFGVLMWEVYTDGMLPYEERPDEEVLISVDDDLRLTKPERCPGKIYKIMESCWADDKEDRLTFGQVCEEIAAIPRESEF